MSTHSGITVVVGNPTAHSRTRSVGETIATAAGAAAELLRDMPDSIIELDVVDATTRSGSSRPARAWPQACAADNR